MCLVKYPLAEARGISSRCAAFGGFDAVSVTEHTRKGLRGALPAPIARLEDNTVVFLLEALRFGIHTLFSCQSALEQFYYKEYDMSSDTA